VEKGTWEKISGCALGRYHSYPFIVEEPPEEELLMVGCNALCNAL
jgi:hypothetical protein